MTKDQFREIAGKIEAAYRQKFNDLQFDEWWDSFGGEDFNVAFRAFGKMKEEYNYFPMISTFHSYIKGIKEIDESAQKHQDRKQIQTPTPMDSDRYERWVRFNFWIQETGRFPKTSEEAFEMKAKFEKEHPNWKRKEKIITNKPETIGQILK